MITEKSTKFHSINGYVYSYSALEKQWYKSSPATYLPLDVKSLLIESLKAADALPTGNRGGGGSDVVGA